MKQFIKQQFSNQRLHFFQKINTIKPQGLSVAKEFRKQSVAVPTAFEAA